MHDTPEEVARKLWSAVADGDAQALERMLAPNVVWHSMGQSQISGEYRGPAEVMTYLATVGELTDEFVTELDEIFVAENSAVVAHHATAMRGERRLEMNYLIRLEIHDGRVTQAVSVPVDQRENDDFWGESAPYVN